MSVISKNRFSLGTIAKVRRSPAKRTALVSLETSPYPWKEQKFALQASAVKPICIQNTISSPKCDFFEKPHRPKRILFVSLGFSEHLRWSLTMSLSSLFYHVRLQVSVVWEADYSLIAKFPPRAYLMQHNPEEIYNRRQQPHRVSYISEFILKSIVLLLVCVISSHIHFASRCTWLTCGHYVMKPKLKWKPCWIGHQALSTDWLGGTHKFCFDDDIFNRPNLILFPLRLSQLQISQQSFCLLYE